MTEETVEISGVELEAELLGDLLDKWDGEPHANERIDTDGYSFLFDDFEEDADGMLLDVDGTPLLAYIALSGLQRVYDEASVDPADEPLLYLHEQDWAELGTENSRGLNVDIGYVHEAVTLLHEAGIDILRETKSNVRENGLYFNLQSTPEQYAVPDDIVRR